MPKLTVSARKADLETYTKMAAEGEIPAHAIKAYTILHAAARKAQALLPEDEFCATAYISSLPRWSSAVSCAVAASDEDIAMFERLASRFEIGIDFVPVLATVFAAMRKAQTHIGPGHFPIDAMMAALPEQYVRNWVREQKSR